MDKKTADQIRKVFAEAKASGEILIDHALVEPKDEVAFIKKKLCELFIDFCNKNKKEPFAVTAERLGVSEKELNMILHYHVESFSLDLIVGALAKLAKIDHAARKALGRLALAV